MGFNQIEQIIVLQFTLRTRELLMLHSYAGFQAQRAMHWSRISCLPKNVIVSSFSYRFCWLLHHMCVFRLEARTKWKSLISATLLKRKMSRNKQQFWSTFSRFCITWPPAFFFFFGRLTKRPQKVTSATRLYCAACCQDRAVLSCGLRKRRGEKKDLWYNDLWNK